MKLCWSKGSPFVRKVSIALKHHNLWDETEVTETLVWAKDSKHEHFLPIGKIPALEIKPDYWLFDSNVICQYVDDIGKNRKLYTTDENRWEHLRVAALADGILENSVVIAIERTHREDKQFWFERHAKLLNRNNSALDELERLVPTFGNELNMMTISLISMIDWIELRQAVVQLDILERAPKLCQWAVMMNETHQIARETKPE